MGRMDAPLPTMDSNVAERRHPSGEAVQPTCAPKARHSIVVQDPHALSVARKCEFFEDSSLKNPSGKRVPPAASSRQTSQVESFAGTEGSAGTAACFGSASDTTGKALISEHVGWSSANGDANLGISALAANGNGSASPIGEDPIGRSLLEVASDLSRRRMDDADSDDNCEQMDGDD